jgi:replicative DNA helicase
MISQTSTDTELTVSRDISASMETARTEFDSKIQILRDEIAAVNASSKLAEQTARRRLLLAIEKRIFDIQQATKERRQEALAEVVSEYRQELLQIFTRYSRTVFDKYGGEVTPSNICNSIEIDFESIWKNSPRVTNEYRMKFISTFLERTSGDPKVIIELYKNVFSQFIYI